MALFIDLDSVPNPSPPGSTPSVARVWLGAASSDFPSGHNAGALSTGLVITTAGVPSSIAHGTNTHILTMVAGVPTWAASSGGVTSLTAGAGLTGGGIGAVTVNVVAANGTIVVNADSIQVGEIANANVAAAAAIAHSKLADAAGASVLGRSASSAGAMAPILSGADGQVMIRIGGAVNFGQLTASSAVGTQTNGFVLTLVAGIPTWSAAGGGTIDGSGAATRLAIWSDADTLTSDAALTFASNALTVSASSSGATVSETVANTSNTASSKAAHTVQVAGTTADDPTYNAGISGGAFVAMGIDNSVAGDPFVISMSTSGPAVLGTNNVISASTVANTGLIIRNPFQAGTGTFTINDSAGTQVNWSTNSITVATTKTQVTSSSGSNIIQEFVNADVNIGLFAIGSYGSGSRVLFIGNRTTAPSTDPAAGGILYAESGALKWRGSSGTVTTIANA